MAVQTPLTAATLLRSVGLLADGPAVWGRPFAAAGPGVFVVELSAPLASAPIELTRVGKWIERLPAFRLDGEAPTSKARGGPPRLVLDPLDDRALRRQQHVEHRRPGRGDRARRSSATASRTPAAHWLKTLIGLERTRVWWARTAAVEEYEDALFGAFAEAIPADERARLHAAPPVLPFANLRSTAGERKAHGLTGFLVPEEPAPRRARRPGSRICRRAMPRARPGCRRRGPRGGTTRRAPRAASGSAAPRPPAAAPRPPAAPRSPAARPRREWPGRPPGRRRHVPVAGGHRPPPRGARDADDGEAAGGHPPDQDRQGARRPQGERRLHRRPARSSRSSRAGSRTIEGMLRTAVVIEAPGARWPGPSRVGGQRRGGRRRRRGRRLPDRRLGRGESGRGPDLELVAGRARAHRAERRRDRRGRRRRAAQSSTGSSRSTSARPAPIRGVQTAWVQARNGSGNEDRVGRSSRSTR